LREEEAKKAIVQNVIVTRQHVILAKLYLLNLSRTQRHDPQPIVEQFATQQGCSKPNTVFLRPDTGTQPDVQAAIVEASEYLISVLSVEEAIWELIHEGIFLHDHNFINIGLRISWTTAVQGSGHSGDWRFDEFEIQVPGTINFAPSYRYETRETLTDPNLFILEAGIKGADIEVIEALQDAVNCFRKQLYRPAVVLLGKAMEGAWVEVGIALIHSVPDSARFDKAKFEESITDAISIMKKIDKVLQLYKNKDLVGHVVNECGIRASELENIAIWSKVLQDARNAIHYGVKPTIPNTYEKVAVLLLASADSLSKLYHIKRTAEHS